MARISAAPTRCSPRSERWAGARRRSRCDLARPETIGELFDGAASELGGIDVAVANAGVELIDVPFVDYTEDQYEGCDHVPVSPRRCVARAATRLATTRRTS